MRRAYGAPRESIQMIALRTGRPPSSTGTVPDHCAVQQTAATASGGTTPRAMSREDTWVIMAHQPSGSCSAPPPGRSRTWCASSSAATTSPDTETSATFSAEVPRSIARMCRSTSYLEGQVEVDAQHRVDQLLGQRRGHAVHRGHPRADTRVRADLLDRLPQVGEEPIGHTGLRVPQRDRDVYRGRPLQPVQAPAAAAHVLQDLEHVQAILGAERDDPQRVAEHADARDPRDAVADFRAGLQNPAGRVEIPALADGDHRRPARGRQRTGPAPRERGGQVQATRPVGARVVLELPQVLSAVQDHRRALGGVAVLVRVGRHRGDARQPEVERRHRVAEPLGPGHDEPPEAGIDVAAGAALGGQRGDLRYRVDHTVRERRRRRHHDCGPLRDGLGHGRQVGLEALVHRHPDQRHIEEPGGLVERRVRGHRRDDLRRGDATTGPGEVPVRLHRQQDALGPAGGDRAGNGGAAVRVLRPEHVRGHGDDLRLELRGTGPQVGVQRVALRLGRVHAVQECHVLGVAVVDGAGGVPVAPPRLLGRGQAFDQPGHLGTRHALFRKPRIGGQFPPVRLQLPVQGGDQLVWLHGHGPSCAEAGSLADTARPARPATDSAARDRYGFPITPWTISTRTTPPRFPASSRNPTAAPARSGPLCSSDQSSTTGSAASSTNPSTARATATKPTECTTAIAANETIVTATATCSSARRRSRLATACGTTAAPRIPATVMIAIRYPAALPRPKWPSIESSQVATALNTPIPTNSRPARTHRNRSPHSQRSDTATDGSPRNAARVRSAISTQAAATTARAACTDSSSRSPPASNSGLPMSTATRMPRYNDTLPAEIAAVRSRSGKYRAATLVIEFSTSGCPAATTICPASAHAYEVGPTRRSRPPPAVRIAPVDSARSNRASSQRPLGRASTTYISGKITARSPTAPTETSMTRWAWVVIGA